MKTLSHGASSLQKNKKRRKGESLSEDKSASECLSKLNFLFAPRLVSLLYRIFGFCYAIKV